AGEIEPLEGPPLVQLQDEGDLDLGEVLGFVAHDVGVAVLGADAREGETAEVDLVREPFRAKVLLPLVGDVEQAAALGDEQRGALAPERFVLAAREHGAPNVEAGALDDAPDLLPGEGAVR